jgi:hypothetical protein
LLQEFIWVFHAKFCYAADSVGSYTRSRRATAGGTLLVVVSFPGVCSVAPRLGIVVSKNCVKVALSAGAVYSYGVHFY